MTVKLHVSKLAGPKVWRGSNVFTQISDMCMWFKIYRTDNVLMIHLISLGGAGNSRFIAEPGFTRLAGKPTVSIQ